MLYQKFDRRWQLSTTPDEWEDPVAMFVYGTLRSGDRNAIATIHGYLHDVGVAIATDVGNLNAGIIIGEVLYCERSYMKGTLDRYEGYPYSYGREQVMTLRPKEIEVWVYTVGPMREDRLDAGTLMTSPACWREQSYWKGVHNYDNGNKS